MTTDQKNRKKNTPAEVSMDIDAVAEICGYFTSQTEKNNGYGCTHPKREEDEGCCHRTGCPVAWYNSEKDQMVLYDRELIKNCLESKCID